MSASTNTWSGINFEDLTQAQKEFLKSILEDPNKSFFLTGCAGSGKTVIAAHALSLLRKETSKTVGFLVYTKLLRKFIEDGFENENIDDSIWHFHDWYYHDGRPNRDIFLIDECQDFKIEWIDAVKSKSSCQIWLGDDSQQIYEDANGFEDLFKNFSNTSTFTLNVNYRNCLFVARFASKFIRLTDIDKKKGVTLQQKIDNFILPIINNPLQAAGANNQPVVFIESSNKNKELDAIARIIKDIVSNTNEHSRKVAIAHFRHAMLNELEKEFNKREINCFRITEDKKELPNFNSPSLIILTPIHSLKGLEVDYVIFPRTDEDKWSDENIFNNLLFVLFTRARKRIYCSFTNRYNSFIYSIVKDDPSKDFYQFVNADEILENGNPSKTPEDIDDIIKKHFENFNI
jgi:superfamily I DNA/RNA helicase